MKKIKQHYVWKYYLEPWTNNNLIWCIRNGSIFNANRTNIAQERFFYKLPYLNEDDINIITELIINNSPEALVESHNQFIDYFTTPHKLKQMLNENAKWESHNSLDVLIESLQEEYHSFIESNSIKFIEELRNGDISFLSDAENIVSFYTFLFEQYFRTKKIKDNILSRLQKYPRVNINAIWPYVSHLLATNVAFNTSMDEEYKVILLLNRTTELFITSDQPIINTFGKYDNKIDSNVDDFEVYYPISPKIALLISKDKKYIDNKVEVGIFDVQKYNEKIANASHDFIFASSENELKKYQSLKQ